MKKAGNTFGDFRSVWR